MADIPSSNSVSERMLERPFKSTDRSSRSASNHHIMLVVPGSTVSHVRTHLQRGQGPRRPAALPQLPHHVRLVHQREAAAAGGVQQQPQQQRAAGRGQRGQAVVGQQGVHGGQGREGGVQRWEVFLLVRGPGEEVGGEGGADCVGEGKGQGEGGEGRWVLLGSGSRGRCCLKGKEGARVSARLGYRFSDKTGVLVYPPCADGMQEQ